MSRISRWERDKPFMAIAAVAWPDDFAVATKVHDGAYGPEYNQRMSARSRMKLRWEGYRHVERVESKLRQMQSAVSVMSQQVERILATSKEAGTL